MITTSTEVKARLGITVTTYDTRIAALIDETELEFLKLTRNNFLNDRVKYSNSDLIFDADAKTVTSATAQLITDEYFVTGWYFVSGSVHNDGWHQVSEVTSETVLTLENSPVDEDSGYRITLQKAEFPSELKSIIAEMIGETLAKEGVDIGVKSESLGSHSITYEDGYSKKLMNKINKYRKLF